MNRRMWIAAGIVCLVLLLAGGAFMAGRLLGAGPLGSSSSDGATVQVSTKDGQVIEAQWVRAEQLPQESPDVAGVYARMQDNSFFINLTEGGFVLARDDDGSFRVSNATGKISEVVVTKETAVYVDITLNVMDEALSDGKLYQQLQPGTVEEIGELSFVRAWGEMRGDRLIASVLVYSPPPVIQR
jgi:hypothetical protein